MTQASYSIVVRSSSGENGLLLVASDSDQWSWPLCHNGSFLPALRIPLSKCFFQDMWFQWHTYHLLLVTSWPIYLSHWIHTSNVSRFSRWKTASSGAAHGGQSQDRAPLQELRLHPERHVGSVCGIWPGDTFTLRIAETKMLKIVLYVSIPHLKNIFRGIYCQFAKILANSVKHLKIIKCGAWLSFLCIIH